MASNYDNSAWFYDSLSRLVYGRSLIKAQLYLLQYIPPGSKILIAGGGTGWILEEITRVNPTGLQIIYAEISAKMTAISKKRNTGDNQVTFINSAVELIEPVPELDVIITPFLFDNFTEQTQQKVFNHLNKMLKPNGIWLNTDFQLTGKWWQSVLLNSMFIFFKFLCNIETTKMYKAEPYFKQCNYHVIACKTFFKDFVISTAYRKPLSV